MVALAVGDQNATPSPPLRIGVEVTKCCFLTICWPSESVTGLALSGLWLYEVPLLGRARKMEGEKETLGTVAEVAVCLKGM